MDLPGAVVNVDHLLPLILHITRCFSLLSKSAKKHAQATFARHVTKLDVHEHLRFEATVKVEMFRLSLHKLLQLPRSPNLDVATLLKQHRNPHHASWSQKKISWWKEDDSWNLR